MLKFHSVFLFITYCTWITSFIESVIQFSRFIQSGITDPRQISYAFLSLGICLVAQSFVLLSRRNKLRRTRRFIHGVSHARLLQVGTLASILSGIQLSIAVLYFFGHENFLVQKYTTEVYDYVYMTSFFINVGITIWSMVASTGRSNASYY